MYIALILRTHASLYVFPFLLVRPPRPILSRAPLLLCPPAPARRSVLSPRARASRRFFSRARVIELARELFVSGSMCELGGAAAKGETELSWEIAVL